MPAGKIIKNHLRGILNLLEVAQKLHPCSIKTLLHTRYFAIMPAGIPPAVRYTQM